MFPRDEFTLSRDGDSWLELKSFGYRQREYLVSGTARALDGSTAPYTTRVA